MRVAFKAKKRNKHAPGMREFCRVPGSKFEIIDPVNKKARGYGIELSRDILFFPNFPSSNIFMSLMESCCVVKDGKHRLPHFVHLLIHFFFSIYDNYCARYTLARLQWMLVRRKPLLVFAARKGQRPISAFMSRLDHEIICLLAVSRSHCVETANLWSFVPWTLVAFFEYLVHLSSLDAKGSSLLKQ